MGLRMKEKLWMIGVRFIFYIVILLGILEYYQMQDSAYVYGVAEGESGCYFLTQEYKGNGLELKLLCMSEESGIEKLRELSLNNTFRLTDFAYENQVCVVTGIEQLTGEVYVYYYDIETGAMEKESYASYAGYVPVDAIYREDSLSVMDKNGNIYTEMSEITAEEFENPVVPEELQKEIMKYQNQTFWLVIVTAIIGCDVVLRTLSIVLEKIFKNKKGLMMIISLISAISMVIMAGIFTLGNYAYYQKYLEERKEKSEFYGTFQKAQYEENGMLEDWIQELGEKEQILYQANIFQVRDGIMEVFSSSSYAALSSAELHCGTEAVKLLETAGQSGEAVSKPLKLNGTRYMATAVPLDEESGRLLLVTASMMGFAEEMAEYQMVLGALLGGCWIVFNMIIAVILICKTRVLDALHRNLELLSEGSNRLVSVKVPDNEFGDMYKLLSKICIDIEVYQYADKITRNYYERFVPHGFEQFFERGRLREVSSGERMQTVGTILSIQLCGQTVNENVHRIEDTLTALEKHRKSGTGVVLTGQSEAGNIRVLYKQGEKNADEAVRMGIEILNKVSGMLILHFSRFTCVMAGNEKVAIPYVRNEEVEWLANYAEWLKEKGICMIITDEVRQQLVYSCETRYIGYIQTEDKTKKIDLFEVLDAYDKDKRYYRNSTKELFENALNLFYQNDFYFARNNFLEVLKRYPDDGIARWYVFACEEMFNRENMEEIRHDLFLGKKKGD